MSFQIVLNSVQNNQRSPKHKQNSFSPNKELRRLKIQLADRTFQIKKQEEDYAQQKAHLLQAHSHERNILTTQLKQLYQKMSEENQYWEQKVDQLRRQKDHDIQKTNTEWIQKYNKEMKRQLKETVIKKFQQPIKLIFSEVQALKQELKTIRNNYSKNIGGISSTLSYKLHQLQSIFSEKISCLKKAYTKDQEMKISAVMHIKGYEEKEHNKTKKKLAEKEKQLETQRKKLEETISQLREQLWSTKQSQQQFQLSTQELTKLNKQLKSELMSRVNMTAMQYEKKIKEYEGQWRNRLETLNDKWKLQVKKLQGYVEKLQIASNQKEKIREERANRALDFFEKRQARQEDIKLIENLEIQLIKKQFELERQKQGLKEAKLELDNMDDIYKRVFYSAAHHHSYSVGKHKNSGSFNLKKVKLPGIMNRSTHPLKNTFEN